MTGLSWPANPGQHDNEKVNLPKSFQTLSYYFVKGSRLGFEALLLKK